MPTKIRLQRHGKKGKPFYQIVVADSRAKRDGRYIDNIGSYNPNTNPATIDINFDKAVSWIEKGAQPTDTMRAILSYKGVLMYEHLKRGVKKGAFTEEQAKEKFDAWLAEKEGAIQNKRDKLSKEASDAAAAVLAAEKEVNAKREAELAAKNKPEEEEVAEEAAEAEAEGEATEPTAEAEAEAPEASEETPSEEENKAE